MSRTCRHSLHEKKMVPCVMHIKVKSDRRDFELINIAFRDKLRKNVEEDKQICDLFEFFKVLCSRIF